MYKKENKHVWSLILSSKFGKTLQTKPHLLIKKGKYIIVVFDAISLNIY